MIKSLNAFECYFEQVNRAVDPQKPSLQKSHPLIRVKLDDSFVVLWGDWRAYKEDTGIEENEFNSIEEDSGEPLIKHNDNWFNSLKERYYELCDKSDAILETRSQSMMRILRNQNMK